VIIMDTDLSRQYQDETLLKRRPWYVLAGVLFIVSAVAHQPIAFLAALFALVVGLVPEIWYRHALRHLSLHQQVSESRVFFGETITLSIRTENRKLLPLPWLEIEDEIPTALPLLTGHASPSYKVNRELLVNTLSLWSYQRVTRHCRFACQARGLYTFGPVTVRSGDPFGWLVREDRVSASATLLVYPLLAPLESFGLPPRHPFGERATPRRLLEDPLRVAGVREYVLGDDPRRIHWKATARAGELRSKIYEPSSQYRLLILLDINAYPEPWMGIDPEVQELTICAAASFAMWALEEGYAVGLLANTLMMTSSGESIAASDELAPGSVPAAEAFLYRVRVPLASGSEQGERLLSALGRLVPYFGSPMDSLIEAERATLPIGTTVVLVSAAAALHEATIESLVSLRTHGAIVHLALTGDDESPLGAETYDLPVHRLGGREVWNELVRTASHENDTSGRSTTSLYLD
jgi:uncharacterized protein (DUF58 family)